MHKESKGGHKKSKGGGSHPLSPHPTPLNETLVKVQGENLSCPKKMFGIIDGEKRRKLRKLKSHIVGLCKRDLIMDLLHKGHSNFAM